MKLIFAAILGATVLATLPACEHERRVTTTTTTEETNVVPPPTAAAATETRTVRTY
jgi:hypothetical protein